MDNELTDSLLKVAKSSTLAYNSLLINLEHASPVSCNWERESNMCHFDTKISLFITWFFITSITVSVMGEKEDKEE